MKHIRIDRYPTGSDFIWLYISGYILTDFLIRKLRKAKR